MHVDLNQINAILEGSASESQHHAFTDHILECESCAAKFKMFRELSQEMGVSQEQAKPAGQLVRIPARYILGVAAVMVLCVTPYLTKTVEQSQPQVPDQTATAQAKMNILKDVQSLNYKAAIDKWGEDVDLADLVAMSNRLASVE